MRLPRGRLTVRRMMIAVAVIALAFEAFLWAERIRARQASYRGWAAVHARHAQRWLTLARRNEDQPDNPKLPPTLMADPEFRAHWEKGVAAWRIQRGPIIGAQRRNAAYHASLADKYERATSRPWLPVPPDPPEPK
jgi:hypothetical protein